MGVNVSELISLERVSRAFGSVLYHQVRLSAGANYRDVLSCFPLPFQVNAVTGHDSYVSSSWLL